MCQLRCRRERPYVEEEFVIMSQLPGLTDDTSDDDESDGEDSLPGLTTDTGDSAQVHKRQMGLIFFQTVIF